jgi:uncharacterized protein (DUF58 family)
LNGEPASSTTRTSGATFTRTRTLYSTTRTAAILETVRWWIRSWRWIRAVSTTGYRIARSTVTPTGWLAIVATVGGLVFGLRFGWPELLAAAVLGFVLLVTSLPFLLGAGSYTIDLHLTNDRVVAGSEVMGSIKIVNTSRYVALPGRIDVPVGDGLVDLHVPLLRPGATHHEELLVPARRRGVIAVGPVTTVRGDPIGVLKREVARAEMSQLYVHPITTSIPSTSAGFIKDLEGNPTSHIVNSDISFHAIREYAPGDAQRQIHWKSTAKTGTLMVRQFEETRRSRLALVLSLRVDDFGTDEEFEMAVSATGSIGVRAIRDGRDLDVITSVEIPEFARLATRSIRNLNTITSRTLLDSLSEVDARSMMMPLEEVCSLASEAARDTSIAFLVCGSTVELRRLQAAALKFPLDTTVVAIVCNPEAEPSFRAISSLNVITIGVLDDLKHLFARGAAS